MFFLLLRSLRTLKTDQHARYISISHSHKPKSSVLEQMAEMVSRLAALETPDAADPSKPADLSGPKPNALRDNPEEEPIPPLPAPVRGYPTPWVTEYDVLSYVYPLYTRGWGQSLKLWTPPPPRKVKARLGKEGIETGTGEKGEEEEKEDARNRYTMLLSARYKFKDYDSAVSFFLKLVRVTKAENHHPSVHIANGNPFTVTVTTQTDSARRPTWVEEQVSPPLPPDKGAEAEGETTSSSSPEPALPAPTPAPPAPVKLPGLTLRDIRLAVLTETIYNTHFNSDLASLGRHIHPANFRLSWSAMERIWKRQVLLPGRETGRRERRRLWVEERVRRKRAEKAERRRGRMLQRGRKRGASAEDVEGEMGMKCYACGEEHHVNDCRKREKIKPHSACPYCQEMHWAVDCPVRSAKHIQSDIDIVPK